MSIFSQLKNLLFGKQDTGQERTPRETDSVDAQPVSPDRWRWPEHRAQILQALESGEDFRIRCRAAELLPYPEERERLKRLAAEDREDVVRDCALARLQYPEDRELLIRFAETEADYQLVKRAVEKLPWPEEREELLKLARGDNYPVFAVKKLDETVDAAVFEEIALKAFDREAREAAAGKLAYPRSLAAMAEYIMAGDPLLDRRRVIEKLPYPACRELLVSAALSCPQEAGRAMAAEKLPWPEEKAVLEALARGEESFAKYAAQVVIARAGICPACGKPVKVFMKAAEDGGSRQHEAMACEACGWEWENTEAPEAEGDA